MVILRSEGSCHYSSQVKKTKTVHTSTRGVLLGCYSNRELKMLIEFTLVSLMKLMSNDLPLQLESLAKDMQTPEPVTLFHHITGLASFPGFPRVCMQISRNNLCLLLVIMVKHQRPASRQTLFSLYHYVLYISYANIYNHV
jgi:hypothetical protein